MAQLKTSGDLFAEDVAIGAGVTYTLGGISIALAEATSLKRVISAQLKGPTGSTAGTNLSVAPVLGSETGVPPSFKLKAYESAGSAAPFAELAAASTALEGLTVSVLYEGQA